MSRMASIVVIDARPRGPGGPIGLERVLGRPVLAHVLESVRSAERVLVRVTPHDRDAIESCLSGETRAEVIEHEPPLSHATIRADRLYDAKQLWRALKRGDDPERAVIWRLDQPHYIAAAHDELVRRRSYQPLGRFWALTPAKRLARRLATTRVRPNHVTLAAAGLMLGASLIVSSADTITARIAIASALAAALVLDTTDGHLARLQGSASAFGRWLDSSLDELCEMALHAAIAWSAFTRDARPAWLALGMFYAMSKYLFVVCNSMWTEECAKEARPDESAIAESPRRSFASTIARSLRAIAHWAGHADVRWHLWIVLALIGRLDFALVAYAAYFPLRTAGGAWRKAVRVA